MAWQNELTEILRALIADLETNSYSALTLQRTLAVAALQVANEMDFPLAYAGKPSVTTPDIVPDPTDSVGNTRNESFMNLTCYKAACIIDHGSAMVAAKQAISVRDGSSSIDLRGIMQGKLALLKQGWCAVYNETKLEYLSATSSGTAGAAIMTPFRTLVYGGFGLLSSAPGRDREGYF